MDSTVSQRHVINEELSNEKVKHLFLYLGQILPLFPDITLTGSTAIISYLVGKYQTGNISGEKFRELLDMLDKVNDIDAIFPAPVYKNRLEDVGFTTHAKIGDVLMEADGIPFSKTIDQTTLNMEIIIEKTLGKNKALKKSEVILDIGHEHPYTVMVVSPSDLIKEYRTLAGELKNGLPRDDQRKLQVLESLKRIETPTKRGSESNSRITKFPRFELDSKEMVTSNPKKRLDFM